MKKTKVIILGSNGQLGRYLSQSMKQKNHLITYTKKELDITDKKKLYSYMKKDLPDYIINTAAYTDVDRSESEKESCMKCNHYALKTLSAISNETGATLIHISTNYVFSSKNKFFFEEEDKKNPVNFYGKSKSQGEDAIKKYCKSFLIFRLGWLYSYQGKNFFNKIIDKILKRANGYLVNDEFGTPTSVNFAAKYIKKLIHKVHLKEITDNQIIHIAPSGFCSREQFGNEIFKNITTKKIPPFRTKSLAHIDSPAERPHYALLDNSKLERLLHEKVPNWKYCLENYIRDYG